MGFDQNDSRPIIHPARRTTKVNFGVVAGVLVFIAAGIFGIFWMRAHKDQDASDIQQKAEAKP